LVTADGCRRRCPLTNPLGPRHAEGLVPQRRCAGLAAERGPADGTREKEIMQIVVSPEAATLVRRLGGRLWVWAARPRLCCWGTPAYMHAATEQPPGLSGFRAVPNDEVEIWFRAPAGRVPDVLEIGLHGRRRPRVEAYWDGCRTAL
jgi:hypothetical protein